MAWGYMRAQGGGGGQEYYAVQHVVSTSNFWNTTIVCDTYSIGAIESDGLPSTGISSASVLIKQNGTNTTQTEYSTLKGGIVTGYSDGMEYTPKQECWVRGVSGNKFPVGEIYHLSANDPQSWSWTNAQEFYVFFQAK